jgi:hypothetical protein
MTTYGFVTETGSGAAVYQIACRHGSAPLPPSSLSARDHPARNLAVSPLHPSYRDLEELLAERGLDISYETVRRRVPKFGPAIARRLRQRGPRASGFEMTPTAAFSVSNHRLP